jgi:Plasmid pRiA4b ORF-3-like protein
MSELSAPSASMVLPLRVVHRGISPLIWRRLLVRSDATIADLHATLQLALGWTDEHLNRFVIQGREYGVAHMASHQLRRRRSRSSASR